MTKSFKVNISAPSIIKTGGTSSQYLMADGSVTTASGGGTTTNALTIGTGLSGTSFNGSTAVTIANTGVLSINGSSGAITNVAKTDTANTFTTSPQTINGAASAVGLIIKANATTPGNLTEWQDSSGVLKAKVESLGHFRGQRASFASGTTWFDDATLNVSPYTSGVVGLIVKGVASQTADLFQAQTSTGTVLSGTNAAGQVFAGSTASVVGSTTTALTSAAFTSATVAVFTYGGTSLVQVGQRVIVAGVTGGAYNGTWTVSAVTSTTFTVLGSGFTNNAGTGGTFRLSGVASFVAPTARISPLLIQGAASQAVPLAEFQNSSGTAILKISNTGAIDNSSGTGTSALTQTAITSVSDVLTLQVRAFAGQSSTIQEWQNSGGTPLATITSSGAMTMGSSGSRWNSTSGDMLLVAGSATTVPLTVKGLSTGQTGDIQQWSAPDGTVLQKITAAGVQIFPQPTPNAQTATATLTIANLLTGIITSTSATAVTLTLPTGTLSDGGFWAIASDQAFGWSVINLGSSAGAVTMAAAATGHTYVGNTTIAISTSAQFRSRRTAANTWVTYRIS